MPRRDNISPGRVARAERRRKKEEGNEKPRSGLMKLIMMNPGVSLAVFGTLAIIIFAIIAYMLFNANVQMDEILKQYLSLSTRVSDSKRSFTKKKYYITVNADGTTSITINMGTGSMVDDTSDGIDEDSGPGFVPDPWGPGDGGGGGNTNPSSDGVFEKLSETSGTYNFEGKALTVKVNNGQEFPAYSGIPEAWGWSESTNATVWHYQNTGSAWVSNFSSETGASSVSTYKTLNKEYGNSTLSEYKGVKCLQICTTAAIVNCGFTPSGQSGANDVGSGSTGVEGVIIVKDSGTGNYYYIPAYVTDAKAHTYPGGIVQTSCARYSNFSQCYNSSDDSCSDFGKPNAYLHTSSGHYVYSDRVASVEIEANWTNQPIKSNWTIVDVIIKSK